MQINPGVFNKKIQVIRYEITKDSDGFETKTEMRALSEHHCTRIGKAPRSGRGMSYTLISGHDNQSKNSISSMYTVLLLVSGSEPSMLFPSSFSKSLNTISLYGSKWKSNLYSSISQPPVNLGASTGGYLVSPICTRG